jgi:outer membrane receptor protein involved in Fe transport
MQRCFGVLVVIASLLASVPVGAQSGQGSLNAGILVMGNNVQSISLSPASMAVVRGDLTYFREGWRGSHEFKVAFWGAPRLARDVTTIYSNDGFVLDEYRQVDPLNPNAGLVPFHQQYRSPADALMLSTRDRDVAFYVQDAWRPGSRVTANVGVRVNFVRRHDEIFNVDRERARQIGPRAGIN